jgi:hypothetical protein
LSRPTYEDPASGKAMTYDELLAHTKAVSARRRVTIATLRSLTFRRSIAYSDGPVEVRLERGLVERPLGVVSFGSG